MKSRQRFLALVLSVCLGVGLVPTQVQAQTLKDKLSVENLTDKLQQILQDKDKNKEQQNAVEKDKEGAQQKVNNLKDEANELGGTYYSLDKRLKNVTGELNSTRNAISAANADIKELEKELEQAKKDEERQKEEMKKRIQFMYERGNDSLLISILTSGSVTQFVKRAEYASMIASYDRNMIESFEKLQKDIVAKSEQLETRKQELSAYQETLDNKQDELDDLVGEAGAAYSAKKNEVSAAQMTVDEYNRRIAEFQALEAKYDQQYAATQAEIAKQIADEEAAAGGVIEDTSGALGYSQEDLYLMAAIIQAESGGEPYEGQLAVGSVIMNRVMSSRFPNTLRGVIYQKNQFQPVRDGHLDLILERGPNQSCTNAAKQVLGGYRSGDWLFFMTKYWADYYGAEEYTMIGNHAFFRTWPRK